MNYYILSTKFLEINYNAKENNWLINSSLKDFNGIRALCIADENCLPCDVEEQPLIPRQFDKLEQISFAAQKYKMFISRVLTIA